MRPIQIDGAHRFDFTAEGSSFPVYRDGSGPGVLILHELPGMTEPCIRLAERVMNAPPGFTVYLPLFFGRPGQRSDTLGLAHVTSLCVRHEFECFATDKSGHLSRWLRALCGRMRQECGGSGVGAIGMCLTGGIILSVMIDDHVLVPVVSQPALPFHEIPLPGGPSSDARKRALGIDAAELAIAKQRAEGAPILGYRFKSDTKCPAERFQTLREVFGGSFHGTEIGTGPSNPGNIPDGSHSVLTDAFRDEPGHPTRQALDEILAQFAARLPARN
jgi:dienelactone hydrolase